MSDGMSLKSRLFRRAFIGLLSMAAMLFLSAGSLKFWQAWAFLALIYFMAIVMSLFIPLALGSCFALPAFAVLIPLLVLRLLNEEKVLGRELPGYAEYCLSTRFRLIPLVW
jgi:protein-S-isoprenylcysteine O-methyltransferase Ste14